MDDHHPGGMNWPGLPTIFHPAPSPFGIPYRCLYSRNIANLFCAGRNISVSHAALSATRVMATCATIGQAVGAAAAIAARHGLSPRGVHEGRIRALQQLLMDDDCYLPFHTRQVPALTEQAVLSASEGDPQPLRSGLDRPVAGVDNGWSGGPGAWVAYAFPKTAAVGEVRLVFDSDLNRSELNMLSHYARSIRPVGVPETLIRAFRLEVPGGDGAWQTVVRIDDNHQRLVRVPLDLQTDAIRFVPEATWGAGCFHVFAWDVAGPASQGPLR
jgi:hypothetical protein